MQGVDEGRLACGQAGRRNGFWQNVKKIKTARGALSESLICMQEVTNENKDHGRLLR